MRVNRLADAIRHINGATLMVGIYPDARRVDLPDRPAAQGLQWVTRIGRAGITEAGLPHDGFLPLRRFIRWVNDED